MTIKIIAIIRMAIVTTKNHKSDHDFDTENMNTQSTLDKQSS